MSTYQVCVRAPAPAPARLVAVPTNGSAEAQTTASNTSSSRIFPVVRTYGFSGGTTRLVRAPAYQYH